MATPAFASNKSIRNAHTNNAHFHPLCRSSSNKKVINIPIQNTLPYTIDIIAEKTTAGFLKKTHKCAVSLRLYCVTQPNPDLPTTPHTVKTQGHGSLAYTVHKTTGGGPCRRQTKTFRKRLRLFVLARPPSLTAPHLPTRTESRRELSYY